MSQEEIIDKIYEETINAPYILTRLEMIKRYIELYEKYRKSNNSKS